MVKKAKGRAAIYELPNDVLKALNSRGFKIGRTSLFADIKSDKLHRTPGVGFLMEDVERYASTLARRNAMDTPGGASKEATDLGREKLAAEVDRLRNIVRKQDLDYQQSIGRLCKSGDFYLAIAERLSIMKSRVGTLVRVRAIEYVKMSPDDFVDAFMADFAVILHEFSRPPEYDAEEVPDVFREGRDVAGRTEKQEGKHGGNDDD